MSPLGAGRAAGALAHLRRQISALEHGAPLPSEDCAPDDCALDGPADPIGQAGAILAEAKAETGHRKAGHREAGRTAGTAADGRAPLPSSPPAQAAGKEGEGEIATREGMTERERKTPSGGDPSGAPSPMPAQSSPAPSAGPDAPLAPAGGYRGNGRSAGGDGAPATAPFRPGSGTPRRNPLPFPPLPLGPAAVDGALGGGLARGAVHEAAAQGPGAEGALDAFALALAAHAAKTARRPVLLVQQERATWEAGRFYAPGLDAFGLPPEMLLLVEVRKTQDVLFVMEECLRCTGLAAVLGTFATPFPAALTATRRLSLAARDAGTLGLLLRQRPDGAPCAARTRWIVAPLPSPARDGLGGLGPPTLKARLVRNRLGPMGGWPLALAMEGPPFVLAGNAAHDTVSDRPPPHMPADGPPIPFPRPPPAPRPLGARDVA